MALLRVVARLGSPVVLREALHLDAILAAVHPSCVGGLLHRGSDASEIVVPPLPLATLRACGVVVHMASADQWPPEVRRRSGYLSRRRDGDDLDHLTRPVQTASGPDRDVLLRFPSITAPTVSWLAVGDRRGVQELLRRVGAVGALRRHGYGAVLEWTVREEEGDPASVLVASGVAQRHLPAEWCEEPESVVLGAWRLPYWHASVVGPRVSRGTPTGLRAEVREGVGRLR